ENLAALKSGIVNLEAHISNMQKFGVPVVVAINHFGSDAQSEIDFLLDFCAKKKVACAFADVFAKGGEGGTDLASLVCKTIDENGSSNFAPIYPLDIPIKEKISVVTSEIYHAGNVSYTVQALKSIEQINSLGFAHLPVCIAKTQYSLSDDPAVLGAPSGFTITVKDVKVSAGAGFIVVYTGNIMTMPGLSKYPAAMKISIDNDGKIDGLF
ncbi:MAG: formate--tetrahydrofolate ligase, partial [Oscillospiraceae bacterium]